MTSEEKLNILRDIYDDVELEIITIQLEHDYTVHEAIDWLWEGMAEREDESEPDLTEIM